MKDCVRYAPMIGAREGELAEEPAAGLAAHLAGCAACRARQADLRAMEGLVSEALAAEAAERDFAPFVDAVMDRVGARRAGIRGWLRHFRIVHPRILFGAALAPLVAAAALFLYFGVFESHPEVARMFELNSIGSVDTVLQTSDGPVVLLGDEAEGS